MSLFYINETNTLKNHKEKVGDIMTSLKNANRRVGSVFAVAALVLATVTPGLIPAFASAAQLSERSVELSNSSKGMDNVDYTLKFTPSAAAAAVVLEFCSNTPLIETACTPPAGLDAVTNVSASGFTDAATTYASTNSTKNAVVLTGGITAAATTIELKGVNNPDTVGALYVRMVTYDTEAHALAYESDDLKDGAVDQGSAAISITDSVGVSGAVLETMTFCVSGALINGDSCTAVDGSQNPVALTAPTVQLGEPNGDIIALSADAVSSGSIYSQISTNAAGGAVVNLRSSAKGCGGLLLAGESDVEKACNIAPTTTGITKGNALFGVTVDTATDPNSGANSDGSFNAVGFGASPFYLPSTYKINYVDGDASGVTGPYGDPLLDTAGAPVNNKNAKITFGASIANNTPAGRYSADFSLIATGKF